MTERQICVLYSMSIHYVINFQIIERVLCVQFDFLLVTINSVNYYLGRKLKTGNVVIQFYVKTSRNITFRDGKYSIPLNYPLKNFTYSDYYYIKQNKFII